MDVKVLTEELEEIEIKESVDDEVEELTVNIEGTEDGIPLADYSEYTEDEVTEDEEDDFDINSIADPVSIEEPTEEDLFTDEEFDDFEIDPNKEF